MANICGVDFACAGWSANDPRIDAVMKQCADYLLKSPAELYSLLF